MQKLRINAKTITNKCFFIVFVLSVKNYAGTCTPAMHAPDFVTVGGNFVLYAGSSFAHNKISPRLSSSRARPDAFFTYFLYSFVRPFGVYFCTPECVQVIVHKKAEAAVWQPLLLLCLYFLFSMGLGFSCILYNILLLGTKCNTQYPIRNTQYAIPKE